MAYSRALPPPGHQRSSIRPTGAIDQSLWFVLVSRWDRIPQCRCAADGRALLLRLRRSSAARGSSVCVGLCQRTESDDCVRSRQIARPTTASSTATPTGSGSREQSRSGSRCGACDREHGEYAIAGCSPRPEAYVHTAWLSTARHHAVRLHKAARALPCSHSPMLALSHARTLPCSRSPMLALSHAPALMHGQQRPARSPHIVARRRPRCTPPRHGWRVRPRCGKSRMRARGTSARARAEVAASFLRPRTLVSAAGRPALAIRWAKVGEGGQGRWRRRRRHQGPTS